MKRIYSFLRDQLAAIFLKPPTARDLLKYETVFCVGWDDHDANLLLIQGLKSRQVTVPIETYLEFKKLKRHA